MDFNREIVAVVVTYNNRFNYLVKTVKSLVQQEKKLVKLLSFKMGFSMIYHPY